MTLVLTSEFASHRIVIGNRFDALISATPIAFRDIKPSTAPQRPGVYLITALIDGKEQAYYIGRTKNLSQRLYQGHLHGNLAGARLKKHLISSGECDDPGQAKQFIKDVCAARWIEQDGFRERGAVEGYATALLFPKHGIYEEH